MRYWMTQWFSLALLWTACLFSDPLLAADQPGILIDGILVRHESLTM